MKGTRKPGQFCWINILTARPADARAFFEKLLDWTYAEIPGMGHRILVDGRNIGGLFDLEGPQTPPGTKPIVGVMVMVESADATCEKVKSLGGKAQPAFDIMDEGRMAVCTDPSGAEFDIWEPKKSHGSDADSMLHGSPSWTELMTTDVAGAGAFYTKLFGWTAEPVPGSKWGYVLFQKGATQIAGMMAISKEMGAMRPHWVTYFTVKDADATVRQAAELGGKVVIEVQQIPDIGRFAGIVSPQGVGFCILQYDKRP
jgi:predicted enzyme related to lactoylglutathione lyase